MKNVNINIPVYQDMNNINVNSAEKPRLHWSHRIKCWKYRKQIENSRKPGRRVIDNIDVGYLTEWLNPVQLGIDLLNPGGEVFLPAGTFTQTDAAITTVNNLKITGSGYASILKLAKTSATGSGTGVSLINAASDDYLEISHMYFWGDNNTIFTAGDANEGDHGIGINGGTNIFIHHNWFLDMPGDCVYVAGTASKIRVSENIMVNTLRDAATSIGRNCVAVVKGTQIDIVNNTMRYGRPAAIDLETNTDDDYTISDILIANNQLHDSPVYGIAVTAVQATAGKTATIERVNITGNNIYNTTGNGIYVFESAAAGTSIVQQVNIDGNILEDCLDSGDSRVGSIELRLARDTVVQNNLVKGSGKTGIITQQGCDHIDILNNRVYSSQLHGIWSSAASGTESTYFKIIGNTCKNNSVAAANTSDGIVAQYTDKSVIANNYCVDDNGTPNHKYGVEVQNCDDMFFGHVHGTGFGTAKFRITSESNIHLADARPLATWWYDDLAQNQAATAMKIGSDEAGASYVEMPFDGHIVAMSVSSNAAVTAGSLSIRAEVAGAGQSSTDTNLDTTNTTSHYKIIGDSPLTVTQGQKIRLTILSSATYTPDGTNDIRGTIWIL